jgi:hypothetical protein
MKNKVVHNITVGKSDTRPTTPGHVPGIFQGNHPHGGERSNDEDNARRSTGVNAKHHDVIDPKMPRLSPS